MKTAIPIAIAAVLLAACGQSAPNIGPYAQNNAAPTTTRTDVPPREARAAPDAAKTQGAAPAAPPPLTSGPLGRDTIDDSAIASRIKAAILSDPALQGADISVSTDRGVVSLTGTVKSQEQAALASAHAQRQDGVMRVDNRISPLPR